MADCKRSASTIVAMNDASPNGTSISKKRKTTASLSPPASQFRSSEMQLQLLNSNHSLPQSPDKTISPVTSVNSAVMEASDEIRLDWTPLSRFRSRKFAVTTDVVKELETSPLDSEVSFFEILSSPMNFRFRIIFVFVYLSFLSFFLAGIAFYN